MIPREFLRRIRRLEIRTRKLVEDTFAGEYHSVFKGRGMEFAEVREYVPGDDVRLIDWNVSSRMGHLFVKQFMEERELTVMLVLDASGSSLFGTAVRTKRELQAEIAATLAFSAVLNNDRVGMLVFTDQVEKFIPPKKGRTHALSIIRDVLYFEPKGTRTSLDTALRYLINALKKTAVVFILSDFIDDGYEKVFRVAAHKYDLIAVLTGDEREFRVPDVGIVALRDAETGREELVDTSSPRVRSTIEKTMQQRRAKAARLFLTTGVDKIELSTDRPYDASLKAFFGARAKRRR
ncbi:MAG: DUF58 domain-containing protein [Acidobacteriota bacterium]